MTGLPVFVFHIAFSFSWINTLRTHLFEKCRIFHAIWNWFLNFANKTKTSNKIKTNKTNKQTKTRTMKQNKTKPTTTKTPTLWTSRQTISVTWKTVPWNQQHAWAKQWLYKHTGYKTLEKINLSYIPTMI